MEEGKQSDFNTAPQHSTMESKNDYVIITIDTHEDNKYKQAMMRRSSKVAPTMYSIPEQKTLSYSILSNQKHKNKETYIDKMKKQSHRLVYPTKHPYLSVRQHRKQTDMYLDQPHTKVQSHMV